MESLLTDWLPALMGPGGLIVFGVVIGRTAFKFLTGMLDKMEARYQQQELRHQQQGDRHDAFHRELIDHMHEQTAATSLQTEALRNLTERIQIFLDR